MHISRYPLIWIGTIASAVAASAFAADESANSAKEKELLAVLRSDAPSADKAITCKRLAIHGSSEAVADLAKLLPDPQLSSWARIALEVIPGPAADEALRKASESLEGRLLVGAINSIGVRRDAGAVEPLTARLTDKDAEVASAAAVALGRIGTEAAAKALRPLLATAPGRVRSAVAEGCVLCAERFLAAGQSAAAIELYDEVRKADVPKPRIIEATRGAILARNADGIPLLIEQFRSFDKAMFNLALTTAREFPGDQVDKVLADEMVRAAPAQAALIIQAMADRKETVVLAAVLKAAGQGPKPVRLSALSALGRVGDASCLPTLLESAVDEDADLAQAAKTTLSDLPGDQVNAQLAALLPKAEGKQYALLIDLVGQRRILSAVPALLKAVDHSDKSVRTAALSALGETVDLKGLGTLIAQVVSPKHPDDAAVAQQALKAASVRMPDREACAAELTVAFERSSGTTKVVLLDILTAVGGTKALATVGAAAKSSDPALQDASSRLLGEWMTADAAPVLLDLAKSGPAKFQVRSLRGYIRIARQFVLPEDERSEMCQKALDAARQPAEQKLVLDVLKRYPNTANLKLALKTRQDPDLKEDATAAALFIAQKLGAKGEVADLLAKAQLEKVKLEILKAEYGAGATQKDVTAVLQKQAGDLPLITLASSSYNTSFGGDPAPGTVKQLKIQYRINGKSGEASFAEDALIVLPMPK